MSPYSARQFGPEQAEHISADEDFLEKAGAADACFVELSDPTAALGRADRLIVYRWNRTYPFDLAVALPPEGWTLAGTEEFSEMCIRDRSTIPSMRWPATRPDTAAPSRACWRDTSSKPKALKNQEIFKGKLRNQLPLFALSAAMSGRFAEYPLIFCSIKESNWKSAMWMFLFLHFVGSNAG